MPSPIIDENFSRIDLLASRIDSFAPIVDLSAISFRADLAGLLTVFIAAHYENCVKETMISYAAGHSKEFEGFVERQFEKLNSKICVNDLHRYAKILNPKLADQFSLTLKRRRKLISALCGRNVEKQLQQLLNWRHEFAHAGNHVTTVEEALLTHRLARVPIVTFEQVFSAH